MLDCEICKYFTDFWDCGLIERIKGRYRGVSPNEWCPFRRNRNRDALMVHILSNYGDLKLKFSVVGDRFRVMAKLYRKFSVCLDEVMEVEGSSFFDIENALIDVLETNKPECTTYYKVLTSEIWHKCPIREGITFIATPLNSYTVET